MPNAKRRSRKNIGPQPVLIPVLIIVAYQDRPEKALMRPAL